MDTNLGRVDSSTRVQQVGLKTVSWFRVYFRAQFSKDLEHVIAKIGVQIQFEVAATFLMISGS